MSETPKFFRPRINYRYIGLIREKFPKETKEIETHERLIVFAIDKLLTEGDKK